MTFFRQVRKLRHAKTHLMTMPNGGILFLFKPLPENKIGFSFAIGPEDAPFSSQVSKKIAETRAERELFELDIPYTRNTEELTKAIIQFCMNPNLPEGPSSFYLKVELKTLQAELEKIILWNRRQLLEAEAKVLEAETQNIKEIYAAK